MTQTNTATEAQLSTIRARAVNDEARAMMAGGVTLTHEQADALGQEALAWVGGRLGLNVAETDSGVVCTPPKHYASESARAAGIEVSDEGWVARKPKPRSKVGGARAGAGRPLSANPRTVKRAVPLLPEEAAAHDAARGDQPWADWMREAAELAIARGSTR